ncbi:MBL fold metallo-hydrolase [Eggerthellaceae bacterium zg-893]|nr:MBL fold metallo-hydrolase [Eggerthellaceae bacterium zg-893]
MANDVLRLHVLASGSAGNAAVVEDVRTGRCIVIDCGICKRDFLGRCAEAGVDPRAIEAVFVTHDHTDHTKGLGVTLRGLGKLGCTPPVYALDEVLLFSSELRRLAETTDQRRLSWDDPVSAAGMEVVAFPTSHDAAASCGFRVECSGKALGYLTDSGVVTPEAHDALRSVHMLALESNHDVDMLANGPYPFYLKQRVGSQTGHLSNDQACDELAKLLAEDGAGRLEAAVAMHVSRNNNTYRLPREGFERTAASADHDVSVSVAFQDRLVSAG